MHGELRDGEVRVGGDARQRFHDARGYGRPLSGNEIALAPVEAAHLLFRGDLTAVDGMDFRAYLAHASERADATTGADAASDAADRSGRASFVVRFLVYADLRRRGFYLSPAREAPLGVSDGCDLVVYPRGKGPGDGEVAHRVRVVGERRPVPAAALGDVTLAVVDEESEITYFGTDRRDPAGENAVDHPDGVAADLLSDRVVAWDPPATLHDRGFYGQPLAGRSGERDALQLSLVEAAHLTAAGTLDVPGGRDAVVERGRAVEGDRFDRRLRAYAALRDRGVVPKTGFKFGADFRTYADVASVEDLGHSEHLVRVVPADHAFDPRDLALDVRLAHGVRKEMTFALVGDGVEWLSASRLTP